MPEKRNKLKWLGYWAWPEEGDPDYRTKWWDTWEHNFILSLILWPSVTVVLLVILMIVTRQEEE